jgi:ABC-2 type transport system permease protein
MTVFQKELADHFGSKRFLILFAIVIILATVSAYQGSVALKESFSQTSIKGFVSSVPFSSSSRSFLAIFSGYVSTGGGIGFSFTYLMMWFGPIIGLALGFDAVSKERSSGSLSVLLSQPIFRDSVINGKFLAGISAIALMVASTVGIMVGVAIPIVGFGPTLAETTRIIMFALLTVLYMGFWLALSILFSTAFKKTTTSILATISSWIFLAFAIAVIAGLLAQVLVAVPEYPSYVYTPGSNFRPNQAAIQAYNDAQARQRTVQYGISSISPSFLYQDVSNFLFTGMNMYGSYSSSGPATPSTDLLQCWPQFTAIAVGMVVCFAAAYVLFLRREIRPGG